MGQHYKYLRMPFGMVNSSMTMTRAVRKLLDGMNNLVDYIDDLLVHTRIWDQHVQILKELFQAIEGSQPCCKAYKVCFLEQHKWIFFRSLFGIGYDWVARCQCPEDEGRT